LTWSKFHDNVRTTVLSLELREEAEIRDYLLIALSVFYKCMF